MHLREYLLAGLFAALGLVPFFAEKKWGSMPTWLVSIGGCVAIFAIAAGLFHPLSWLLEKILGGEMTRGNALALLLLAFASGAAIVWWSMPRGFVYDNDATLKRVVRRTFKNEVVPLDGREYIDCTFENVKFHYNGTTRIALVNPRIINPPRFSTDNKSLVATIAFLFHGLGANKVNEIVDPETGHNILSELGQLYPPGPEKERP